MASSLTVRKPRSKAMFPFVTRPLGGVDIHDQLRCYHPTQLTVLRNWMPLFFWLLDACLINAFLICRSRLGIAATKARDIQNNQRLFRLRLGWNLVMEGGQEMYGQDNVPFQPALFAEDYAGRTASWTLCYCQREGDCTEHPYHCPG